MSDEVILQGKSYVSSKRAADETGYARDYIGQLARGGQIDAERVGGLWYVSLESLRGYEQNADAAKTITATSLSSRESDSMLSFEGKDYISASRASKVSGYNQDYVGQLARAGKIPSRQIGNRWYVDRDALTSHKAEKDALLAAVQAESVGLRPSLMPEITREIIPHTPSHATKYVHDERELMPVISKIEPVSVEPLPNLHSAPPQAAIDRLTNVAVHAAPLIPAVIRPDIRPIASASVRKSLGEKPLIPLQPRVGRSIAMRASIGALTIMLVLSIGFATLKSDAVFATVQDLGMAASATQAVDIVGDAIEDIVSPELTYERGQ